MPDVTKLVVGAQKPPCMSTEDSPLILGAGGWNIFHHFGVLKALEEHNISFGPVVGVSAGSITAALVTNGYSPEEMVEIFLEVASMRNDLSTYLGSVTLSDPISMSIGGLLSLKPIFTKLVEKYKLEPNDRLKIVACDLFTHTPFVFEGCHYNLVDALAASGAVPGVYQPVWHMRGGLPKLLVDGAIYHYSPVEFTSGAAIVSKFRPADGHPREWKSPLDLYFHYREVFLPLAGNNRYVDSDKHLVIESGLPHVAALNNGLSEETLLSMVENGYQVATRAIEEALDSGRFCNAA